MVYGVMLWALMSLIPITLIGYHPFIALFVGAMGGAMGGFLFFRKKYLEVDARSFDEGFLPILHEDLFHSIKKKYDEVVVCHANDEINSAAYILNFFYFFILWILRTELILTIPAIVGLLLSKHVPYIISALSIGVIFIVYARRWWWGRISIYSPFDLPIFILLLISFVGLYISPSFQDTLSDVFGLGACIVFFYFVIHNTRSHERFMVMVWGGVVMGGGCAFMMLWVMEPPHLKLPILGEMFTLLPDLLTRWVNPNYVGGVLVFFLPISVWIKNKKPWMFGVFGVILLVLLLTQSRGALFGVGLAVILTSIWQFGGFRWLFGLFISGICLVVFWVCNTILIPFEADGSLFAWTSRRDLWQWAIYIIQDFPFTGIGLHSFPLVVKMFYPLFDAAFDVRVPHVHNLFLQIAVDTGIPGFVAFWMLLGIWGGIVWELFKRTQAGLRMAIYRPWVLGIVAGMIAHLIYGIMDTIALGEVVGLAFWFNLALMVSLWRLIRVKELLVDHE